MTRLEKILIGAGITIGVLGLACCMLLNKRNENDEQNSHEPMLLRSDEIPRPLEDREPDWVYIQEETDDDGNPNGETIFTGYVDEDNDCVDWFTEDGFHDSTTSIPCENSIEWESEIVEGTVIEIL